MMDIDLVNNILNKKHRYNNQKLKKYCHICEMNNHNTNECHFNMKNKIKNNINNKKYKNHKKGRNHHNRKNHLGFINNEPTNKENKDEISSDSDGSIYFINNINDEYINKYQTTWVYDTGASERITNNKDILENFITKKVIMKCANNTICEFSGYGTYKGKINNYNITLNKVLYSDKIAKNLISGIKLAESNIPCEISNKNFKPQLIIKNNNKIIFKTHVNKHNNFKIKTQNNLIPESNTINCLDKNFSDNIWHNRLGHYYNKNLKNYLKLHNVDPKCKHCQISKLNRKSYNGNTPKASRKNEIIYSDIMGPVNESINHSKYVISFIDDATRKGWIFPLKNKSEASKTIINFIKIINNIYPEEKIKIFKSDNTKEYNNKKI